MPYWCGAGFGLWWIFPLIFGGLWIALISLFVLRIRRGGWGPGRWAGGDATHVLRERFARGDIDADEYERRLRVLDGR